MTACGMLGLFVGVTNRPISTLLLGFELLARGDAVFRAGDCSQL